MSVNQPEEKNLTHFDKQQQRIFDIITGKIRYQTKPFRDFDLAPNLIMKISVPNAQYIPRNDYLQLSNYVAFPSQKLERSFQKAEKIIIDEMNRNKQNNDPSNLRIRLQKAIIPTHLKVKQTHFLNQYEEQEPLEIQSIYKHSGELDCFSLEFNTIIYILQEICGFRVRAFLLYDEKQEQKDIYLFLTLSSDNLVKLAKRYRIKKEIDYTFIDFFLNDPTGHDKRPLKYSYTIKTDKILQSQIKSINRYFMATNSSHQTTEIIEESELTDEENINFRDYLEEMTEVYEYFKYKCSKEISNKEKSYIFDYNRRKINKGCEDMFALIKQRREFFQINKQVLSKFGYKYQDEPLVYEEFILPDKQSKNSSFFERLYCLLLYKPMIVNQIGDLDLFLNMEKTKLCYLIIKNNFKVSYLNKMGFQFLSLGDNFQKFGNGGEIEGGINGRNLQSDWSIYAMFPNSNTIRNYVGDNVGFEILINSQLIMYYMTISLPFALLFITETVFGSKVYLYTTLCETLLYAISYQIFLHFWEITEKEYINNYSDSVSSKIFLSNYRGPYKRNLLTDEVNEFQPTSGMNAALINTLCAVIIITLLVIMGAVFHGCRMLLLTIYDPLSHIQTGSLSLPHIIAYLVFFIAADLAAILLTNRLISLMVRLQNPPTDEDEEDWRETLTFFYLIGLQLIPPFFFLILQPFSSTSCYADACIDEVQYYVFARLIVTFLVASFRLAHVFLFKYLHLKQFFKKDPPIIYQDKLSHLLSKTLKEAQKKEHLIDKNAIIAILINFSIYCNVLPLISILALIALFMHFTNTRLGILYEERRPINRSERIIFFSKYVRIIFYIGIICQVWISVFSFDFVELHFQQIIQKISTMVTYQGIFLLKLVSVFVYFLILISLSNAIANLSSGFTNDALQKRKNHKFKEYLSNRGLLKIQLSKTYEPEPVKTIFRSFNPDKMNHQILDGLLDGDLEVSIPQNEEEIQHIDSLINITLKNLK